MVKIRIQDNSGHTTLELVGQSANNKVHELLDLGYLVTAKGTQITYGIDVNTFSQIDAVVPLTGG